MRARLSTFFRIAFAVGLTIYIVTKANLSDTIYAFKGTDWRPIALACVLVVIDRTLMAYRWLALLAPVGSARPPFGALMRIFFVSTFVGSFLPASVGSDAARVWGIERAGVARAAGLASVLMDRLLGVVSVLVSAVIGLMIAPDILHDAIVWPSLAAVTAGSAVFMAVVFSNRVDDAIRAWLSMKHARWLQGAAGRVLDALQAYRTEHRLLGGVLFASVAVQVLRILQAWLLGRSLGLDVPITGYFALIPLILLVMMAPISISGLGAGNAAFVWGFSRLGVSQPSALALSFMFIALGIAGNLPGGIAYVFGRKRPVSQSPD